MNYQIAHSIHEIEAAAWDAVAGSEIGMSHQWLRVIERCWQPYAPRYVLLHDEQGPQAVVVTNTKDPDRPLGRVGQLLQRLMVVVMPPYTSIGCGVLVRPGADRATVLPQATAVLDKLLGEARRPLLLLGNLREADLPLWRTQGFVPSPQPAVSLLDLPDNYDVYLQNLPKKDRAELRRMRRKGEELQVELQHGPLQGDGEAIYPLLREVFAHYQTPMPFTPAFFIALEAEMPGQAILFKGFVNGELAGVSLCLRRQTTLWWPMVGLNYTLSRPSQLYFLLIDEMVRWGIANGIRQIYGGVSKEREKRKHGFYQQARWIGYRARSPLLNTPLRLAIPLAQKLVKSK